jgi:hypothetical protein
MSFVDTSADRSLRGVVQQVRQSRQMRRKSTSMRRRRWLADQ